MKTRLIITAKQVKPFKDIQYAWYKAERMSDSCVIRFGSKETNYEVGDELELDLEKREQSNGGVGYFEVSL